MIRWATTLSAVALVIALLLVQGGCSPAASALDGTQWKLVEWTLSSIDPADVTITAVFAGGQLAGRSGVNSYSGPYKLGPGGAFSAGPFAGTLMAGPEPAMRAESAYLTLLGQAGSYQMANGKLTLYDGGGNESLIFDAIRT
jgi:heat shock protein HslJ